MKNKIITIKKLENGRYYFDMHEYLISFIISLALIFPLTYLVSKSIIFSLFCTLLFSIFLLIILKLESFFGKKVHKKIFEKPIFHNLLKRNYKKEIIGDFNGLVSTKDGSTIRIFYNWNKLAQGILSFGDIDINILYEPPFRQDDDKKVDMKKLNLLTKKYDRNFLPITKRTLFTYSCLRICINYYPWTDSKKVENEVNRGLQILKENNMKLLDINSIKSEYLKYLNSNGYFTPNMEIFGED